MKKAYQGIVKDGTFGLICIYTYKYTRYIIYNPYILVIYYMYTVVTGDPDASQGLWKRLSTK